MATQLNSFRRCVLRVTAEKNWPIPAMALEEFTGRFIDWFDRFKSAHSWIFSAVPGVRLRIKTLKIKLLLYILLQSMTT